MDNEVVTVFWVIRNHRSKLFNSLDHGALCTDRDTAFRICQEQLVCRTRCCMNEDFKGVCHTFVEEEQITISPLHRYTNGNINYSAIITAKMWQISAQRCPYRAETNIFYQEGLHYQTYRPRQV